MRKETIYRVLLCLQHTWLKSNTGLYCLQTLQPFVATGFAGALQEGSQTTVAPAPWLSQQEALGAGPGGCAPEQDHTAWTLEAISSTQLLLSAPYTAERRLFANPAVSGTADGWHIPQLPGRPIPAQGSQEKSSG